MNDANIIIQRTDESSVPVALDQPPAAVETRMLVERPPPPATEPAPPPPPPFVRPQQQQQQPPRRPPAAALFQQQRRPAFQQRPKQQPQQRPYVPDTDAFKDFANPNKRMPEEESVGSSALDLPDYGDDGVSSVGDGSSVGGGGRGGYVVDEEEIVRPSLGFASIEDEKQDIILKLHRLKQKGFPVTKNFGMSSDIFEMRTEISKIKYNIELDASIKFSRKMLMGTVSGIEFMNRKWNPFELALDGWSENVMESLDDYDPIFEKLYDKYKGKVSMPPEMELLLAVSGSAFMFHLSHSMLRSLGPSIAEKIKNNPEILKSAVRDAAAEERIKQQQHQQQQSAAEQRPMRGPTIDPPKPPEIVLNHPESTRTPAKKAKVVTPLPSSSSSSDNMSSDNETTEDERISDVVSEDMKSVASVSLSDIKTIDLGATTTGRGRGRGRGRAAGAGRGRGRGRAAAATEVKSFDI